MYAYEKLLKEHKLTIDELPEDAKIGIKQIKSIEVAIDLQKRKAEKNGKTFTMPAATAAKIKSFDKWVVGEIVDYVEGKNVNPGTAPVAAAAIIEEIKTEPTPAATVKNEPPVKVEEPIKDDPKGIEVDKELAAMLKAGKTEVTLEELKPLAPTSYGIIFETYKKDEENGIVTTHYSLLEKNGKFVLTKK